MAKRKFTTHIIIHCSVSDGDITHKDIDSWHRERGFRCGGYHKIFNPDGSVVKFDNEDTIEYGRQINDRGAHADVAGKDSKNQMNYRSLGYCWIGGKDGEPDITSEQYKAMLNECVTDMNMFEDIKVASILGHSEVPGVNKLCPIIEMPYFREMVDFVLSGEKVLVPGENDDLEPECEFIDIQNDRWSFDAIRWATQESYIMNGIAVSDGKIQFDPDSPMTREQVAVIFYRYDKYLQS